MMEENLNRAYLGRGWGFPTRFNFQTRNVELVAEEADIRQSLMILLGTRPGERVMRPDFGCNLDIMLFEPLTTTLITEVKDVIRTAILYYEPRIEVLKIEIHAEANEASMILIELEYLIRNTNSRFNLVYPFYLDEASNAQQLIPDFNQLQLNE